MFKKLKSVMSTGKSKVVALGAVGVAGAQAQAAITYDAVTGFGGSIDTIPFTSAVVIAVGLTALVIAVRAGLRALKGA